MFFPLNTRNTFDFSCYHLMKSCGLLHSPVPELSFLPAPCRGSTRASERRVQDNLHAHAQSEPIKNPSHAARVNVSRNAFFSAHSQRKHFFDVDIVVKNIKRKNEIYGLSWSILLSTTSTRRYSFPKHFFRIISVCWVILQKFLKGKSDAYK